MATLVDATLNPIRNNNFESVFSTTVHKVDFAGTAEVTERVNLVTLGFLQSSEPDDSLNSLTGPSRPMMDPVLTRQS